MDGRLQRLNIELHALHAPDAHDGAHGDRLAGLAARGPRLAADIDGPGGEGVVDGLGHARLRAEDAVGVRGDDVLAHKLLYERACRRERDDGHDEKQCQLQPHRPVADGRDQPGHAAEHEPDGCQPRRRGLHHAEEHHRSDPDYRCHIAASSFQTQADQAGQRGHARQNPGGQPLVSRGQIVEKCRE